ncbi:MAG: DUF262 domain-containing protein [Acidobacteriia bacterium]|nr:DUF262 domain-containing protein [Terriglobia bacterium]MYK10661.1 DUF262 domain-containing protein [Terriglobia bacterium]
MHAHDRFLPEWFSRIRSRLITLPRFQRFAAWGHSEVSGLLTTVLRGLPSGAALILEVGDSESFISRTMLDAPDSGGKVSEQLLDGQQRLTALWRSLNDKFEDRTYLIGFEEDPINGTTKLPYVYGQARWYRDGKRYPIWTDVPDECWKRGFIPIKLLCPSDIKEEIDHWIENAIPSETEDKFVAYKEISSLINDLRTKVREFNLPYLALPATTPKEVALDVFIKMNTSSVMLSTYDIVVALVEEETGKSLHQHVHALATAVPRASDYADLPSLVLDVVALRQDRVPSRVGYRGIDYKRMLAEWESVKKGIGGMVTFLEDECIFDGQRLPSYTAIPIVAAMWQHLPSQPDSLGNARHLLKKFLWRAFLTSRYEQSSATNALQDYRGLRRVLVEGAAEDVVPILNEDSFPIPTREMILQADWPRRKSIIGRGVLALTLKSGALDLADGVRATVASITSKENPREYHHLFPDSTLEDAGVPDEQSYRSLNCALITWRTNRVIANKDPICYLRERVTNGTLGEPELRYRLRTHLIPHSDLAVGYEGLSDHERRARVKTDYPAFVEARSELVVRAARAACEGRSMELSELFPDEQ